MWPRPDNPLAGVKSSSYSSEDTRGLPNVLVWELTKKQAAAFRLPAVQVDVLGW